ncbi:suppressor of glycerol defect [Tieghemiomyces parasiticus]|uniref:Suppressor of glycerol defect n=1 Tax=Tieghemiomyces parasiticus TaxID=78921 RepID=A0A9W8DVJ7_9FUNG|nr:suppressor of glycerol defect [Tieghemiomyces parasiticus]
MKTKAQRKAAKRHGPAPPRSRRPNKRSKGNPTDQSQPARKPGPSQRSKPRRPAPPKRQDEYPSDEDGTDEEIDSDEALGAGSAAESDEDECDYDISSDEDGGGRAIPGQDAEDAEMRRLEKQLGFNKKSSKAIAKELASDGLDFILDGLNVGSGKSSLASRSRLAEQDKGADETVDPLDDFADFSDEEASVGGDDDSEEDDSEENGSGDSDSEAGPNRNGKRPARERGTSDTDDTGASDDGELEAADDSDDDRAKAAAGSPVGTKASESQSVTGRYVPPHLRARLGGDSERMVKIRRQLQGLLNRLSESNLEPILGEVEALYRKYPRAEVTTALTSLILQSVTSRSSLLDTFVSLTAAFVAAVYRSAGVEAAAHFVQETVTQFDQAYARGQAQLTRPADTTASGTNGTADEPEETELETISKECINLVALVCELYNFQVLAATLVYDLLRLFTGSVNELNVELLLKVVKTSGLQLRHDDPALLKEIISEVNRAVAQVGVGSLNARTHFMIDVLTQLRTNRLRDNRTGHADSVVRLKKFLGNLSARRSTHVEALRVTLDDIRNVGTQGRWWLVGASWTNEGAVAVRASLAPTTLGAALADGSKVTQELLDQARKQNMNTDVRKSIFLTLMTSADYADAHNRLTELGLKRNQEREIVHVLVQSCGSEKVFNPFYALVAQNLCNGNQRFKMTFQFALWDFLRLLGEKEVGGLNQKAVREGGDGATLSDDEEEEGGGGRGATGKGIGLHRLVNIARLYAYLVNHGALSLLILKSINFTKVQPKTHILLQMLFIQVFSSRREKSRADYQTLIDAFTKVATFNVTLSRGILYYLHAFVRKSKLIKDDAERELVQWGCKVAKEIIESHRATEDLGFD